MWVCLRLDSPQQSTKQFWQSSSFSSGQSYHCHAVFWVLWAAGETIARRSRRTLWLVALDSNVCKSDSVVMGCAHEYDVRVCTGGWMKFLRVLTEEKEREVPKLFKRSPRGGSGIINVLFVGWSYPRWPRDWRRERLPRATPVDRSLIRRVAASSPTNVPRE